VYDQIVDVARFGRIKSFLGVIDEYGVAIGDGNQSFVYTRSSGMRITAAEGRTVIDNSGVSSEYMNFPFSDKDPDPTDQYVRVWYDPITKHFKAKMKDGAVEKTVVIADFN